jgi:LPXTG-motif cell wall-anchored protein
MQAIWEFMQSLWFLGGGAIVLIGLIGLFFYLRNKQSED